MQRCVHGKRSYGRRLGVETDRRSQPSRPDVDRRSEGGAHTRTYPPAVGLYDPAYEHDGCGVACLARLDGRPAHETISRAIASLENLEHRGAEGADAETGDGAGPGARTSVPVIRQLLIGHGDGDFERALSAIRRRAERGLGNAVAFPSFSSRTRWS